MRVRDGRPEEIGIVVYPGVQQAAVHGLTDLFCIAGTFTAGARKDKGASLHVTHWSCGGRGTRALQCVYSSNDRASARPSALILPPTLTDLPNAETCSEIARWLMEQHERGVKLVSICSGIFLVARTGLLDGRIVSTHRNCAQTLMEQFPRIVVDADQRIIEYPGILTAGGFLAWIDVGLKLVAEVLGDAVRAQTAQFVLSDRPQDEVAYLPDFAPSLAHTDLPVQRAQELVHLRDGRDVSLALMAAVARLERRTFIRRFTRATGNTPMEYCRAVRTARARELLEAGHLSTKDIAMALGYTDTGAFARSFRRSNGMPPGAYRKQVGCRMNPGLVAAHLPR
jgi:transcriptional regulator GlxA family with amidase domain